MATADPMALLQSAATYRALALAALDALAVLTAQAESRENQMAALRDEIRRITREAMPS